MASSLVTRLQPGRPVRFTVHVTPPSELTEILALSDRILVLFEGRVVHETRPAETDERTLGLHMAGRGAQPSA